MPSHSDRLAELRAQLLFSVNRKKLTTTLADIGEIESFQWLAEKAEIIEPETAWGFFMNYGNMLSAFSKIHRDSPIDEVEDWLKKCLRSLGCEREYYLSTFYNLPWVKIQVDEHGEWLIQLCQKLDSGDIILFSSDGQRALGLIEEEHEVLAVLTTAKKIIGKLP